MRFFHDLYACEGFVFDTVDLGLDAGRFEGGEGGDLRFAVL